MIFELTNEHRKYLGLIPVESTWEIVKLNDMYLYFDGDTIRKKITVTENSYSEQELNEKTVENRTILLPKTSKGKPKKLNFTATQSFSSFGVYFSFSEDYLRIGNYTTQTTYHSENFEEKGNLKMLQKWLKKWMDETTENDLKEIEAFKNAERKRCKYREGDFFAFKIDRRNYVFGRILIDVAKRVKTENLKVGKNYGLTHLMGKALIVKLYHKISKTLDVDLNELSQTLALPSQAVMDNQFFYGEKVIIGHQPLEISEYDMLISYSESISSDDKNTVYLQYGFIYKEADTTQFNKYLKIEDKNLHIGYNENPYRNESIGYGLDTARLEDCIADESNKPYWESNHIYDIKYDLRNPINIDIKREIFDFFGLDADKTYEQNLSLAK
nr:immunity 26/phosphotriesterase HocA family protein [uncultured Chryseobacterium sp.]